MTKYICYIIESKCIDSGHPYWQIRSMEVKSVQIMDILIIGMGRHRITFPSILKNPLYSNDIYYLLLSPMEIVGSPPRYRLVAPCSFSWMCFTIFSMYSFHPIYKYKVNENRKILCIHSYIHSTHVQM